MRGWKTAEDSYVDYIKEILAVYSLLCYRQTHHQNVWFNCHTFQCAFGNDVLLFLEDLILQTRTCSQVPGEYKQMRLRLLPCGAQLLKSQSNIYAPWVHRIEYNTIQYNTIQCTGPWFRIDNQIVESSFRGNQWAPSLAWIESSRLWRSKPSALYRYTWCLK